MTFRDTPGGGDAPARTHHGFSAGAAGVAVHEPPAPDPMLDWAPPTEPPAGPSRVAIVAVALMVAALIGACLLFFFVVRDGGTQQTTSDAAPAAPAESIEDVTTASDDGLSPLAGDATADAGAQADAASTGAADESPNALVVTPADVDRLAMDDGDETDAGTPGSEDAATAGQNGDATTTVPPTTAPPTTVAPAPSSTEAPTTQAPTTQPPTTPAPTTAPTTAAPAPTTAPTTAAPAPAPAPSSGDAALAQEILNLTNAERAAAGCGPVILDPTLNAVADAHSEDMAANQYFDHTGLNGSQPWDRVQAAGYPAGGSGENIAQGYQTAADVMNGWMNSTGHRRNILNCSWTELGVGYATGERGSGNIPPLYWTQVFAVRR